MEPARAAVEAGAYAGVSTLALTLSSDEVGFAVSIIGALLGAVVWLVRLEGRINIQSVLLERIDKRVERMAEKIEALE